MWRLVLASLIWAFSYSLNKQNLAGTNPFMVSFIFCAVSVLTFLPALRFRGLTIKKFFQIASLGALEFGLMYIFFQLSFRFLEAYEIALLLITTPIYVVLIDGILNRSSLALPCLFASVCILLSFILVSGQECFFNRWGVLLVQCSNLSFALGQVLVKKFFESHSELSLNNTICILYFGGCCVCGAAALNTLHADYQALTLKAWIWAGILGMSCCGVCHYLWDTGILCVKTPVVAVMNNFQIPLSILVAVFFFNERVDWYKLCTCIGMLAFIFAVFLYYKRKNI